MKISGIPSPLLDRNVSKAIERFEPSAVEDLLLHMRFVSTLHPLQAILVPMECMKIFITLSCRIR